MGKLVCPCGRAACLCQCCVSSAGWHPGAPGPQARQRTHTWHGAPPFPRSQIRRSRDGEWTLSAPGWHCPAAGGAVDLQLVHDAGGLVVHGRAGKTRATGLEVSATRAQKNHVTGQEFHGPRRGIRRYDGRDPSAHDQIRGWGEASDGRHSCPASYTPPCSVPGPANAGFAWKTRGRLEGAGRVVSFNSAMPDACRTRQ